VLSSSGILVSAKQNVPSPRALFDLQLAKMDLIELAPEPGPPRNAREDENLEAFAGCIAGAVGSAASLGRGTIAGVLLQKQAEPATALLPQWLSGYSFLLTVDTNLDRVKEVRAAWVANFAVGAASLPPAQLLQASPPAAAGVHP
jgi:hypothetical protein